MLQCIECHKEKPESEFQRDNHIKRGFKSRCKTCLREREKPYRRNGRENTRRYLAARRAEAKRQREIHGLTFTQKDVERFWSKVHRGEADECWLYQGHCNGDGYGVFHLGGLTVGAHRFAWICTNGHLKEGECVLHRCDVPGCCNPAHHFIGTQADNARDRESKGRHMPAIGEQLGSAKLTWEKVREMRRLHKEEGFTAHRLSKLYGVSITTALRVIHYKTWREFSE